MNDKITQSITRTYRYAIWSRFIKGLKEFSLLKKDDSIVLLLSLKKEALLLAKLFSILKLHSDFDFKISYILIKDQFDKDSLSKLENNIKLLNIDYIKIDNKSSLNSINYNIMVDFNTYDDVIINTLHSIIFKGQYKTIIPSKLEENVLIINPLYFVRVKDIDNWVNYNNIYIEEDIKSQDYLYTKNLIKNLLDYNEFVEMNIFKSSTNVNLDKVLGYIDNDIKYEFNDYYENNNL